MTESEMKQQAIHAVQEAAREAVVQGENIHDAVRDITLKALSEGELDAERVKQVVQAVMTGAGKGAESLGAEAPQALKESMAGIDDALTKSAEASKLAIEEAVGHLREFGSRDLKHAVDDLLALEDLFLDTVKDVATASKETIRETLNDLARHARNSGTQVGEAAKAAAETLTRELQHRLRETAESGAEAAINTTVYLAQAAAGFLDGIAQALERKAKDGKKGSSDEGV
jgi:hypothetical protein